MSDEDALRQRLAEQDAQVKELRARLQGEVGTMKRLVEIATLLNSTLELDPLLRAIMGAAAELLRADSSSLLLIDEETGDLFFQIVTDDPKQKIEQQRVPAGQGIAGWVAVNAQPLAVDDPASDPRHYQAIDQASGLETRNLLAVPLVVKDRVIGVAEAINKQGAPGFSSGDLELAVALASQAAVAIDNARLYVRLADAVAASGLSSRL
jgi:GAF domain-containing protein